jgi:translocation and assembly module TamB
MTREAPSAAEKPAASKRWPRWLAAPLLLIAAAAALLFTLDTQLGHRLITDRIAALGLKSGLRIEVGRIEGSIYREARLRDVRLFDPQGEFARLPVVELDWRPQAWLTTGLDIRELTLRRGRLLRLPKLRPGDPDAPLLPSFDIRIDRFEIVGMTVNEGVAGPARKVDLVGKVDIRAGRALILTDARLGGTDRLALLLDAAPEADRFDLKLDYHAPKGGLLAGLNGADSAVDIALAGKGSWRTWQGGLLAKVDGRQLAALRLTGRAGRYDLAGLIWPGDMLDGIAARAAGQSLAFMAGGTFIERRLNGEATLAGAALNLLAKGEVDLSRNSVTDFRLTAAGFDGEALFPGTRIEGGALTVRLDGTFSDLEVEHRLILSRLTSGTLRVEQFQQSGLATFSEGKWRVPLSAGAARLVTGDPGLDPRLAPVRLSGDLVLAGTQLSGDRLMLSVPGLAASLALRGDIARGGYGVAGPFAARGFNLADLGSIDAGGRLAASFGAAPWALSADLEGRMVRVDNATLTSLAGTGIRFGGKVQLGQNAPVLFERATLSGSKLAMGLAGRSLPGGRTTFSGKGRQSDFGPFTINADIAADGPRAVLTFADPLPAAGLKEVRVALAPVKGGFHIETNGQSTLGPFQGALGLFVQPGGATRIAVERLEVWKTAITGDLMFASSSARGRLALSGGGVEGTIDLTPQGGGQGFAVALNAKDARFGGDKPLVIALARIEAQGLLRKGHTSITGNLTGQGIGQGQLFLGRVAANASMTDGRGQFTASLAGRRGSRFELQMLGDIAPDRLTLAAQGQFAGQRIMLPRRAVLTREAAGWRLAPTQVNHAGGRAIASGLFGGGTSELHLALADMPLTLADGLFGELGLGGRISGLIDYRTSRSAAPAGEFKVRVAGLTRSGLTLTSRPMDLALTGVLLPERLELRAIASEGGAVRGRLQGRVTGLARAGSLADRIQNGALFAQLRYNGPADALWRLAALETFDLTGPISVAADMTGTAAAPSIRGSLAGSGMELQSTLTGARVTGLAARGAFAGSRLVLSSLSGRTDGGGSIAGSGTFDFSGIGERGPGIDLRLAARGARILAREDMAATVTGPLLIRSDGAGGVIAGRLTLDRASWQLGRAAAAAELAFVRTREINLPADVAVTRTALVPWRFLIDAKGAQGVAVSGLGLNSEWSADIKLRGTANNPAILGRADLVRGEYQFAGKRFELSRGRIMFDGSAPPDPRLDIVAEDQQSGLLARIVIGGTASRPEIVFSSVPALPEEELLSRLLFGTSLTKISAPEALQLGAALASLQSGGGLDPINRLRQAVGLDRLRIVPADAALGRGTGIAAGKNITRRLYAEIITDGRGYSATQLEFRVTSWLSLLSAISTAGRESVNVRISKDY